MSCLLRDNFDPIERPFARVCEFCGLLAVAIGVVALLALYAALGVLGMGERWEG